MNKGFSQRDVGVLDKGVIPDQLEKGDRAYVLSRTSYT